MESYKQTVIRIDRLIEDKKSYRKALVQTYILFQKRQGLFEHGKADALTERIPLAYSIHHGH